MKMRTQILFAQMPTALIICIITFFFIYMVNIIKEKSDIILVDNFKSIVVMQKINKSLEELNELSANRSEDPQVSSKMAQLETMIERQLIIQEENVKESGEKETTTTLHTQWEEYKKKLHALSSSSPLQLNKLYKEIKATTEDIVGLNQDGLIRTKINLTTFIYNFLLFITFGSILSLVLGFYMSWFFTGLFLSPLSAMIKIMKQAGREDKTTLLNIKGSEEIENLSNEFNLMTHRLRYYHENSLNKPLTEYQTLKDALNILPEPLLFLDALSNFIYVNKAARHLLKLPSDLEKTPSLFHIESTWKEVLLKISKKVITKKEIYHPQKENDTLTLDKEDKKVLFLPWGYPVKQDVPNERNGVKGVVILLQDLMRKPLSNVSRADLYEKLVHEFQSLLTEIHMAIHMCVEEVAGPLTSKQQVLLTAARDRCTHLEKLCQTLLNLSKPSQESQLLLEEGIDLNTIIPKLIASLQFEADQKGILVHFKEPPYLSKIKANPDDIQTVFGNLLRNALHYADSKSIIKIKLFEKNNFIEFSVNNKGVCIPVAYHKNIFKKHFKVPGQSEERAGLGLYIAKKITTALHGKIGYKCSAKQGTTFWLKLPIMPELVRP